MCCTLFAGDYWPGEAENLLGNISEEQRQAGRKGKGSLTAGGKPRAKSAKVPHLQSIGQSWLLFALPSMQTLH